MKYLLKFLVLICGLVLWGYIAAGNVTSTQETGSIEPGDPEALYALAVKYEFAEGTPRDWKKAMDLYCEAARLGHSDAQYALGWMYANGRGVSKDDNIAAQLFTMAANQGHAYAGKMMPYLDVSIVSMFPDCMQSVADNGLQETDLSNSPVYKLVNELAPEYNVDPALVMAIISVESAFNANAVSHKNAQGLMQLIPATAKRFQVKNSFDAEDNIRGGMAYLRWLLAFFKGDVVLVAAAYNAGEGAVEKYQGIPPYPETISYVQKIQKRYKKSTHPYKPSIVRRHAQVALTGKDNNSSAN